MAGNISHSRKQHRALIRDCHVPSCKGARTALHTLLFLLLVHRQNFIRRRGKQLAFPALRLYRLNGALREPVGLRHGIERETDKNVLRWHGQLPPARYAMELSQHWSPRLSQLRSIFNIHAALNVTGANTWTTKLLAPTCRSVPRTCTVSPDVSSSIPPTTLCHLCLVLVTLPDIVFSGRVQRIP